MNKPKKIVNRKTINTTKKEKNKFYRLKQTQLKLCIVKFNKAGTVH